MAVKPILIGVLAGIGAAIVLFWISVFLVYSTKSSLVGVFALYLFLLLICASIIGGVMSYVMEKKDKLRAALIAGIITFIVLLPLFFLITLSRF